MPRRLALSFVLILLFVDVSFAQTERPSSNDSQPGAEKKEVTSYTLTPEKYEKAVAYSRKQYQLHFIETAYSLLLLLAEIGRAHV